MRRRRSSTLGKNEPLRSLGIFSSTSPALVVSNLGRDPFRWVVRARERSLALAATDGPAMTVVRPGVSISTYLYYANFMVSGDLIKEARLRAGLTQSELGRRLGKSQSVIARWERDDVSPSLETVREVVRACGLDLTFFMSKLDDSNVTIIDQHLRMTPAERFADLITRVRFHERREQRTTSRHG